MENRSTGYSWIIAVIFTFGETAGSGLVALPSSMIALGIVGGASTLIVMCLVTYYTSLLLANNWNIVRARWPEHTRHHCRNPYEEIARRALGKWMGIFTNLCMYATTFGGGAVFSLLAAKTVSEVIGEFGVSGVSMCGTLLAVGLILWPFVMLKSPMSFWQVSIVAALSTIIAVAVLLVGYVYDVAHCSMHASYPPFQTSALPSSLATIIFAYGGHPCIPTIVHDMKNPRQFVRTFSLAYFGLFFLYTPVALAGFWIYGDSVGDSVISSIQNVSLKRVISILIAIHVFFSILIIVNPLLQAVEQVCGVKQEFGIGRFVIRTLVFGAIILSAASVPNFGIVVNLVGGSTLPLLVLILPPIFGICLEVRQKLHDDGKKMGFCWKTVLMYHSTARLFLDLGIIVFGLWVMFHSTFNSINSLYFSSSESSTRSCFTDWALSSFAGESGLDAKNTIRCCGAYRNISIDDFGICG